MKHFVTSVDTAIALDQFLQRAEVAAATASARSLLIQIFSGKVADNWIEALTQQLQTALPSAVIVGATSSGEIVEGEIKSHSTAISMLCFDDTELHVVALPSRWGGEFETGNEIGDSFCNLENLRGILLLAPTTTLDCAWLLEGIETRLPGVTLFGGGACGDDSIGPALVFGLGKRFEAGAVAVALCGASLRIELDLFLGWEGVGPNMTLTDAGDNRIRTIDNEPAIDIYRRYLYIEPGDELFMLEFPLLVERAGHIMARNPLNSDEQGGVTLVADVHSGENVRIGYLNIDTVIETVRGAYAALQAFRPQAILLYSCVCRRFALHQEVELETTPFQNLAPVAGFFTFGEFTRMGDHLQLLNSSQVGVALREGKGKPDDDESRPHAFEEIDPFRARHLRVTSRLFQFISALTEELEAANLQLQHKAEHDALTGAANRHRLDPQLQRELSRAERHGHPLSVIMFDVDHFKRINDDWGHPAGDYVLKILAQTVREHLREHDTLFRFGGEEFLIMLPEEGVEAAVVVAEKIRKQVSELGLEFSGKPLPQVTVSFGVATAPQNGNTPGALVEAADAALYRAKQGGRNRVVVANHGSG